LFVFSLIYFSLLLFSVIWRFYLVFFSMFCYGLEVLTFITLTTEDCANHSSWHERKTLYNLFYSREYNVIFCIGDQITNLIFLYGYFWKLNLLMLLLLLFLTGNIIEFEYIPQQTTTQWQSTIQVTRIRFDIFVGCLEI